MVAAGHEVILIARGVDQRDQPVFKLHNAGVVSASVADKAALVKAFERCDAVAHLAGVNREIGKQTYQRIHAQGTMNVVEAAREAGVSKIALLSFLRARADCGSPYHESKWQAEQIVRNSGLDYTVIKAGVIYGRGDHMLDHLSHALHTFPVFALVGMQDKRVAPLAVEDLVTILCACLIDGRLSRQTVAVVGPEQMTLREAVLRVAGEIGKHPMMIRLPILFHRALAWATERLMKIPMASAAQVRILSETLVEPLPFCEWVPADLMPRTHFTTEQIRKGLPQPGRFGFADCRWKRSSA
jgi:uncharacterized protein YbjT (DUF2867 family)